MKLFLHQGFSLPELIIVLGIIVLMSAIAAPTVSSFMPGIRLNGSARNLTADLREAQEKAVTEQNQYLVRFIPTPLPATYQLIRKIDETETIIKEIKLPSGESITIENTITNNQIVFSPDGGPSSSGNITLSLLGKTKIINVSPAGFIKLTN